VNQDLKSKRLQPMREEKVGIGGVNERAFFLKTPV
jgi:hypothetical protein